jgi:hypothetical protein
VIKTATLNADRLTVKIAGGRDALPRVRKRPLGQITPDSMSRLLTREREPLYGSRNGSRFLFPPGAFLVQRAVRVGG